MSLQSSTARSPLGPLLLIAPFFLWGTAMVAMKGAIPHTTPLFMAGVRLLPAGGLVLLAALWLGRPQPKGWKAWFWIGLFGLVDGTLFQGFLAEGLVRTGAGLGSVMIDSQPLAVALMARWLFGEQVGGVGWLGLLIGIMGISLLGLPQPLLANLGQTLSLPGSEMGRAGAIALREDLLQPLWQNGQWLMLMAALSMAIGTILVRYVARQADPITATGWHMVIGGIPLFLGSAWVESQQWNQLGGDDWLALSYSTIFGSAVSYGLFFYFASTGNLTSFSSLTFLTPVFALLFGNLFLGEVLNSIQWFGVGLTLVSIYLINQREQLMQALFSETGLRAMVKSWFDGEPWSRSPGHSSESVAAGESDLPNLSTVRAATVEAKSD